MADRADRVDQIRGRRDVITGGGGAIFCPINQSIARFLHPSIAFSPVSRQNGGEDTSGKILPLIPAITRNRSFKTATMPVRKV